MGKIRVAVLGLNQGAKAARDAAESESFDLVAVGGFGDQAESVAKEVNAPLYADYQDLYNQVELDEPCLILCIGQQLRPLLLQVFEIFCSKSQLQIVLKMQRRLSRHATT